MTTDQRRTWGHFETDPRDRIRLLRWWLEMQGWPSKTLNEIVWC